MTSDDARRRAHDLACDRVEEIWSRGEKCRLDDHGIERDFGSH